MGDRLLPSSFSAYPGGLHGAGLLLIRVVIGLTVLIEGVMWMITFNGLPRILGGIAVISGTLLALGLRTRLIALVISLGVAAVYIPIDSGLPPHPLDGYQLALFAETLSIASALLGPGAFSIDARLFGRKEIVIP